MKRLTLSTSVLLGYLFCVTFSALGATVNVSIVDFSFNPPQVTINAGDSVQWTNNGSMIHTSVSGANCVADGKWSSPLLSPGQSFTESFSTAGTFPYFCAVDGHCAIFNMQGTVTVNAVPSVIPLPVAPQSFTYAAILSPVISVDPAQAKPIGLGPVATGGSSINLEVALDQFSGPADIYFLLDAPAIDPVNIYLLTAGGTFQTFAAAGFSPWKAALSAPINETVISNFPISALPHGTYLFGILAAPAGDTSLTKFYLWITFFSF